MAPDDEVKGDRLQSNSLAWGKRAVKEREHDERLTLLLVPELL